MVSLGRLRHRRDGSDSAATHSIAPRLSSTTNIDNTEQDAIEAEMKVFPMVVAVDEKATAESLSSSFTGKRKLGTLTHRGLKARHIQLIGVGGTIGTALFVQIASSLNKGGPGSLFLAFTLWCIPILCLTLTSAEMITHFPLASPFTSLAGRCFDEATEVMSGWNFFVLQATLVPFEITSVTYIIHFWRGDFNPAYVIVPQVVLYVLINSVCPVQYFGEVEFWLSILKVILIVGLLMFTFVTMVGGNPLHDAYGFRFWNNPGAFASYLPGNLSLTHTPGALGRFLGFAACFSQACYTISGPDYVSMCAGEAVHPRKILPKAFKGVLYRLSAFFILGSLAMGIVCASNDPELLTALNTGDSGASGSPYVIAMQRLKIPVLPHIVNVCLIASAFSAGNSYFFCASRMLYAMALRNHAPPIFKWCLPNGVPIAASVVIIGFAMLSFLQLSAESNQVLTWIVSLGTVSELLNYCLMSATFLRFYKACRVQGLDRNTLAYKSPFQPYLAWVSLVATFAMIWLAGWSVFISGNWSTTSFVLSYIMIPVDIVIYVGWKLWKRPKLKTAEEIDLVSGLDEVDEHEQSLVYSPPRNIFDRALRVIVGDT